MIPIPRVILRKSELDAYIYGKYGFMKEVFGKIAYD